MIDREARRIRQEVLKRQSRSPGTGVRYPENLRHKALAYVRQHESAGESIRSIAALLGRRRQILLYWRQRGKKAAFRPVSVTTRPRPLCPPPEVPRPVLVTPRGCRVEGLDLSGMVALLRELA